MATQLIAVLGCERSGSAMVERAIHEAFQVTAAGDMSSIWAKGLLGNENCGCGQPFRACSFWTEAIRDSFGPVSDDDARQFDRIFRIAGGQQTDPARLAGSSRLNAAFREIAFALYQSVRRIGGGRPVIDSSKSPAFAAAVRELDPDGFGGLHIFRDARANVHSLAAANEHPSILRAIGRWSVANWQARRLTKRPASASAIISYERFWADQDSHLGKLRETFGLAQRNGDANCDWHRLPGTSVSQSNTRNEPEERWRSEMSVAQRFLTRGITGIEQHMLETWAEEWLRERPKSTRTMVAAVIA
jgi:hypothetical protein